MRAEPDKNSRRRTAQNGSGRSTEQLDRKRSFGAPRSLAIGLFSAARSSLLSRHKIFVGAAASFVDTCLWHVMACDGMCKACVKHVHGMPALADLSNTRFARCQSQSLYNLLLHLTRSAVTSDVLKSLYELLPGDVKTATGASEDPDTAAACLAAFAELRSKLNGEVPDLCIVSITANHDVSSAISLLSGLPLPLDQHDLPRYSPRGSGAQRERHRARPLRRARSRGSLRHGQRRVHRRSAARDRGPRVRRRAPAKGPQ